jgi:hypothetical protein
MNRSILYCAIKSIQYKHWMLKKEHARFGLEGDHPAEGECVLVIHRGTALAGKHVHG